MTRVVLYVDPNAPLVDATRALLAATPTIVEPGADLAGVPRGTVFVCDASHASELARERPDDLVLVARDPSEGPASWRQLAHDVRGPLGVIRGVLEELDEGPMVALGLRGAMQLGHLTDCWEAMGSPVPDLRDESLDAVLTRTLTAFSAIEPRRAEQVSVEESGLRGRTDASRLVLGLTRLLSHAVRATRSPIRMHAEDAHNIVIESESSLEVTQSAPSSALATALSVLRPIADLRVDGAGCVRCVLRAGD